MEFDRQPSNQTSYVWRANSELPGCLDICYPPPTPLPITAYYVHDVTTQKLGVSTYCCLLAYCHRLGFLFEFINPWQPSQKLRSNFLWLQFVSAINA